ncbi:hypothetical protein A2U01_0049243, partial [Trifolium medium]|nr:hypothetical protein [Trifolium medium]
PVKKLKIDEGKSQKMEEKKAEKLPVKKLPFTKKEYYQKIGGTSEVRSKKRHDTQAKEDSLETESDNGVSLAKKFKLHANTSKGIQKPLPKGKSFELIVNETSESQENLQPIIAMFDTKPPQYKKTFNPSPSPPKQTSNPDFVEIDKAIDAYLDESQSTQQDQTINVSSTST